MDQSSVDFSLGFQLKSSHGTRLCGICLRREVKTAATGLTRTEYYFFGIKNDMKDTELTANGSKTHQKEMKVAMPFIVHRIHRLMAIISNKREGSEKWRPPRTAIGLTGVIDCNMPKNMETKWNQSGYFARGQPSYSYPKKWLTHGWPRICSLIVCARLVPQRKQNQRQAPTWTTWTLTIWSFILITSLISRDNR